MDEFPALLKDRELSLRRLAERDLPVLAGQLNDPGVARWLAAVTQPFDPAELMRHAQHPGEHLRVIEQSGRVIGGLCIGAALWYWLTPDCWGQGLMQRALRCTIAARFARPAPPILATCHEDNAASRALLARLGFAPCPTDRRMFFHGTQSSEPCRDYLMAPEQWHLLHPPSLPAGCATLRPAGQKDAPTLAHMLPRAGEEPWPEADSLPEFIETHRFRGGAQGLFVIVDDCRRTCGMALIGPELALRFLTEQDAARHGAAVSAALARGAQSFRCA